MNTSQVVHGGSVLVTLGTNGRVSALQLGSHSDGRTWDRRASEILALHTPAHGPMIFAVDRDIGWRAGSSPQRHRGANGSPWVGPSGAFKPR